MCDLTDLSPSFSMSVDEARMARIYRRHTREDIRDCKRFAGHWHVWIVRLGWRRTTDLRKAKAAA